MSNRSVESTTATGLATWKTVTGANAAAREGHDMSHDGGDDQSDAKAKFAGACSAVGARTEEPPTPALTTTVDALSTTDHVKLLSEQGAGVLPVGQMRPAAPGDDR